MMRLFILSGMLFLGCQSLKFEQRAFNYVHAERGQEYVCAYQVTRGFGEVVKSRFPFQEQVPPKVNGRVRVLVDFAVDFEGRLSFLRLKIHDSGKRYEGQFPEEEWGAFFKLAETQLTAECRKAIQLPSKGDSLIVTDCWQFFY